MFTSLVTLPLRLGARSAGFALRTTSAVTERALGVAGVVRAETPAPAPPAPPPAPPAPDPAPPPPPPTPQPPGPPPPAPGPPPAPEPTPPHISTEPDLVAENADPGAQDGAGAEVRVAEPWDGYRQLHAADVVDRINGADWAQLAAIQLYELSGRWRQTVLDAVVAELERTRAGGR